MNSPTRPGGIPGGQPASARRPTRRPGAVSRTLTNLDRPYPLARATARARGRVVAKATKRLTGGGTLLLRPKRLRGAHRLAVKVTVKPDSGAATSLTRTVQAREGGR